MSVNDTNNNKEIDHEASELDDSVVAEEHLAETVKKLRAQLKEYKKERDEYLAGWQRAKADYINERREHEQKRTEFAAFADEAFFEDLLPVLDSFAVAFANKEAWEKTPKEWRTGVEYIHLQLVEALKRHQITEYEPTIGEPVDPRLHAPIASGNVDDKNKDQTVTAVVKKGYKLKDRVLRPAEVKVGEYKRF